MDGLKIRVIISIHWIDRKGGRSCLIVGQWGYSFCVNGLYHNVNVYY